MNSVQIEAKLVAAGHRVTAARREVIVALLACTGHLSADDLYETLHKNGSAIGRMTVFRTLDLLAEIGVVRPIYQGSGAAHFVLLADGHHHHLVCMQCAQTIEFEDCTIGDTLATQLASRFNFQIGGHLLEIYGVCARCQG